MFTGIVGATKKDPCLHFSKEPEPLTPCPKPRYLDPWVWHGTLESSSLGRFPLVAEVPDKLDPKPLEYCFAGSSSRIILAQHLCMVPLRF